MPARSPDQIRELLRHSSHLRSGDRRDLVELLGCAGEPMAYTLGDAELVRTAARLLEEAPAPSNAPHAALVLPAPVKLPPVPPSPPSAGYRMPEYTPPPPDPDPDAYQLTLDLFASKTDPSVEPERRTTATSYPLETSTHVWIQPHLSGTPARDPVGELPPRGFRFIIRPQEKHWFEPEISFRVPEGQQLTGVWVWVDPPGAGALVDYSLDVLGRGRAFVPLSAIRVEPGWTLMRARFELHLVQSVAQFMAEECTRNAASDVAREIGRLNDEAERLLGRELAMGPGVLPPGAAALDLLRATPYADGHYAAAQRVAGVRYPALDALADTIARSHRLSGIERRDQVIQARAYNRFRREALLLWARKVRPDGEVLDWLDETPLGRALGDGAWDHKPRIERAWGALNRLGDAGRAYRYDVWSNLHYGYVGRAAGFALDELLWGADFAQRLHTGKPDDPRDQLATREGFELYARKPGGVTAADLIEVVQKHAEDTGLNDGSGWADYSIPAELQMMRRLK